MVIRCKLGLSLMLITTAILSVSCSSLSPEMQESLEDIRGSLPGPLRGDAIPLEEQPMPTIGGLWLDQDFPQLTLKLNQAGDNLTINRDGERYGIQVVERIDVLLKGRAIEAKFVNNSPDQIRPTSGSCTGAVSKDSQSMRMSCSYAGNKFPLNFAKSK
jgi:hypothetical protein